jgi:hypothetical protein
MTKMRMTAVVVAVLVTLGGLAGCTSSPAPLKSSTPTSGPSAAPSTHCTGRDGEAALRGFSRDLSNHRDVGELLAAYVAAPEDFVRWWDPSVPNGEVLTYANGLQQHLDQLERDGINLNVTGFEDAGYQGFGDEAGGWFNFGLYGRNRESEAMSGGQTLGNKGAVDCATLKLKAIVI